MNINSAVENFRQTLLAASYPLTISDRELRRYPEAILTKVAVQLVNANTRPDNPRTYILRSLDNEVAKASKPANKQFLSGDAEDDTSLPIGAVLSGNRPLAFDDGGRTWNPRVLAVKAGVSKSKVYQEMKNGRLAFVLRNGRKRIPSMAAHAYIELARLNA